jgi:hypothetical protein
LDGVYSFERYGNSCPVGQGGCDLYTGENAEYRFSVTYTLASPVVLTRYGSCLQGDGYLQMSGTVEFTETGERLDCAGGGGGMITCTNSGSFNFSTTARFCLTVSCSTGIETGCGNTFPPGSLIHQLLICDFPVVNRHSFLEGDCETCDCVLGPETGYLSIGAAICWASPFKDLDQLVLTDFKLLSPTWRLARCNQPGGFVGPIPIPSEPEMSCMPYVADNTAIHGPFSLYPIYDFDWGNEDEPVTCSLGGVAFTSWTHQAPDWDNPCWSVDVSQCVPEPWDYVVNAGFSPPVYT